MAHLLLIDDDQDFADALAVQLRRAGHALTYAAGGDEGLEILTEHNCGRHIDAVLVDMYMPKVDGIETIAALRDAGVKIPVIAISGGGSARFSSVLHWATVLGADASIAKPFVTDRLMMLVDAIGPCRNWQH